MKAILAIAALPWLASPAFAHGDGTFEAPPAIPEAFRAVIAVSSGDFDRDGRLDLAVSSRAGLEVLLRVAAPGGEAWKRGPAVSPTTFWSLQAADFTGDGVDDLVAGDPASTAALFPCRGDGSFGPAVTVDRAEGSRAVAVGDFDRDGRLDLASANFSTSGVSIHKGGRDGTFSFLESYAMPSYPHDLRPLDFDGDGLLDLAVKVANRGIAPLKGKGDGTFTPLALTTDLGTAGPIATADFDGDGKGDLVGDGGVGISRGDGTFRLALSGAFYPAAGDLDGDGRMDLAVSDKTVVVHLGNGDGTFQAPVDLPFQAAPLLAADLDGDGRADIVGATWGLGSLVVVPGASIARPATVVAFPQSSPVEAVAIADWNADGRPDLLVSTGGSPGIQVLEGPGLEGGAEVLPQGHSSTLEAVDLDGDGVLDLAGTNAFQVVVTLLEPTGKVRRSDSYPADQLPSAVAWGRLAGGPGLDLAFVSRTGKLWVLPGRGDGTFGDAQGRPTIGSPLGLAVADLDGDGHDDVLVRSKTAVAVHFGAGGGAFLDPVVLLQDPKESFGDVKAADLDGDGRPDVIATGASGFLIRRGMGGRGFAPAVIPGSPPAGPLAVADLDGNGFPDLAFAGTGLSTVSVVLSGGGTLTDPRGYDLFGLVPAGLRAADMDGDGALDLVAFDASSILVLHGHPADGAARFLRGDANGDGGVDLSDAVEVLVRLFLGGAGLGGTGLPCDEAADANDDGRLDLTDALAVLRSLFQSAGPLPPPGPAACGPDPTPDALGCGRGCP